MTSQIVRLHSVFEPSQATLIEQAYSIAFIELALVRELDEAVAETLARAILIVANERVAKGFSLRNHWDAEAVAIIALQDHFGVTAPLLPKLDDV
ncbi:hypothetical protein [Beijerinckia sp. L45]|uniref:hypothetical protein n=1 Tax=Beijerinckia sp. L45 TaxID=1641855 RepID=UPI00131C7478|nr:hypothetical protein [Beijerinckia sp. L45]